MKVRFSESAAADLPDVHKYVHTLLNQSTPRHTKRNILVAIQAEFAGVQPIFPSAFNIDYFVQPRINRE